jgi:alanine dehydrogenase
MIIGVPKEIKNNENRVGLTPGAAAAFLHAGHEIWVETNAGLGVGFTDQDYLNTGARIIANA